MIDIEASKVLVECSKHIARWAKKGDKPFGEANPIQARAQENAWRLLSHLIVFAEHVKESDLYWKLLQVAETNSKSVKEQIRLRGIAKREDRGYMLAKEALEGTLAEMLQAQRDDPKALKGQEKAAHSSIPKKEKLVSKKAASATVPTEKGVKSASNVGLAKKVARVAPKTLSEAKKVAISKKDADRTKLKA